MTISRRQFIATSAASILAGGGKLNAQEASVGGMLAKPIPSTGELLPVIGLGTLEAFDVDGGSSEEREALATILNALESKGGTLVDTSPRYGQAESVIGDLVAEQNLTDKLFFATKVAAGGGQASFDQMSASLERLHVPQVDLMQVHSMRDWQVNLPAIRNFRDEGKVRYIGVTIHRDAGHEEMMDIMRSESLDFVQVNYNLLERNAARSVLPLAQELDVAVIVNVPFAKAELFKKTSGVDLPGWAQEIDCQTWAQVFLKYVVSHPAVTCVIPRTSKPHHMLDNLMAGYGKMPDQDVRLDIEEFIDNL